MMWFSKDYFSAFRSVLLAFFRSRNYTEETHPDEWRIFIQTPPRVTAESLALQIKYINDSDLDLRAHAKRSVLSWQVPFKIDPAKPDSDENLNSDNVLGLMNQQLSLQRTVARLSQPVELGLPLNTRDTGGPQYHLRAHPVTQLALTQLELNSRPPPVKVLLLAFVILIDLSNQTGPWAMIKSFLRPESVVANPSPALSRKHLVTVLQPRFAIGALKNIDAADTFEQCLPVFIVNMSVSSHEAQEHPMQAQLAAQLGEVYSLPPMHSDEFKRRVNPDVKSAVPWEQQERYLECGEVSHRLECVRGVR